MKLSLPLKNIETLLAYQHGIRGILRRIEIDSIDQELKENIKAVYELLYQLQQLQDRYNNQPPSNTVL